MSRRAPIIEIFDSVQGEGRHVGRRMAFLRLATCPIRCVYCDTPDSYAAEPAFDVRRFDGTVVDRLANPVAASDAVGALRAAAPGVDVVSVTGGEPLVFPDWIAEFGQAWRDVGRRRLHLETAALDPDALAVALPFVDHLSADYKLPSTLADRADHRPAALRCVRDALAAPRPPTVDVKIVLTAAVLDSEVDQARSDLAALAEERDGDRLELILQPVTPFGRVTESLGRERLLAVADAFERAGLAPRVIPQTHRQLGVD